MKIPAKLVHIKHGKRNIVNGNIVSINESNSTVTMSFLNGKHIESGIPMKNILINEGILDKIKSAAKTTASKVASAVKAVVAKIRGFVVLKLGNSVVADSLSAPFNVIQTPAANTSSFKMSVYPEIADALREKGINVPDSNISENPFTKFTSSEEDIKGIEEYWTEVQKNYVASADRTVTEAVRMTNAKFKHLNEGSGGVTTSLEFPQGARTEGGGVGTVTDINATEFKSLLEENIGAQLAAFGPGGKKFGNAPLPLLIWGAPGIGKTSIISQVEKTSAENPNIGYKLFTTLINGATIQKENLAIPVVENYGSSMKDTKFVDMDGAYVTEKVTSLLPVYLPSGDDEKDALIDEFFCTGSYKGKGYAELDEDDAYEGGIIFIDEYSRITPDVANVLNSFILDRKYNSQVVASKFAFVAAANRKIDMNDQTAMEFKWETSYSGRFQQYNYAPKKEEWLEWARSTNPKTGKPYVMNAITDFIDAAPVGAWYECISYGSFDHVIQKDSGAPKSAPNADSSFEDWEDYKDALPFDDVQSMQTMQPRTWTQISDELSEYVEKLNGTLAEKNIQAKYDPDYTGARDVRGIPHNYRVALNNIVKSYLAKNSDKTAAMKEAYNDPKFQEIANSYKEEATLAYLKNFYDSYNGDSIKIDNSGQSKELPWKGIDKGNKILNSLPKTTITLPLSNQTKEVIDIHSDKYQDAVQTLVENAIQASIVARAGSNSYAANEYGNFISWKKLFTTAVCKNIWKTGQMAAPKSNLYMKDNTNYFKSNATDAEQFTWKLNAGKQSAVINSIFSAYPGNIDKDFYTSGKVVVDRGILDPNLFKANAEVQQFIQDRKSEYRIWLNDNNDSMPCDLFAAASYKGNNIIMTNLMYLFYTTNKFICNYINFLNWITKISAQAKNSFGYSKLKEIFRASKPEVYRYLYDSFLPVKSDTTNVYVKDDKGKLVKFNEENFPEVYANLKNAGIIDNECEYFNPFATIFVTYSGVDSKTASTVTETGNMVGRMNAIKNMYNKLSSMSQEQLAKLANKGK